MDPLAQCRSGPWFTSMPAFCRVHMSPGDAHTAVSPFSGHVLHPSGWTTSWAIMARRGSGISCGSSATCLPGPHGPGRWRCHRSLSRPPVFASSRAEAPSSGRANRGSACAASFVANAAFRATACAIFN